MSSPLLEEGRHLVLLGLPIRVGTLIHPHLSASVCVSKPCVHDYEKIISARLSITSTFCGRCLHFKVVGGHVQNLVCTIAQKL